jgi:Asp-tRNA(Asn)/Glu-tRNA(Gln) amidotransferase A subunit family amidase
MRFVFLANLAGIPAVTVPVGVDKNGMPVGVQFMARWWGEGELLEVAKWVEKELCGEGEGTGLVRPQKWVGDVLV